jgi:hypothetical protein
MERFNNYALIVLTAPCGALDTFITISNPGALVSEGNFRLTVDGEIMLATAGPTGDTVPVARAQEGTAATAHDLGAQVIPGLTAGALEQLEADIEGLIPPATAKSPAFQSTVGPITSFYTLVQETMTEVDTTGGPVTNLLPTYSDVVDGDVIAVVDVGGAFATNNYTLEPQISEGVSIQDPVSKIVTGGSIVLARSGMSASWVYDSNSATWWCYSVTVTGSLVQSTLLTSSSGTFTTQPQTRFVRIRGVGGGGASGGTPSTSGTQSAASPGASSGGYLEALVPVAGSTGYAYTCGAGGTPVSGAAGNNGGNATFVIGATTYTAGHGLGSAAGTVTSTVAAVAGPAGGTSTNGEFNTAGQHGGAGLVLLGTSAVVAPGLGGVSALGSTYGNGANGVSAGNSASAQAGNAGLPSCWIVDEYI